MSIAPTPLALAHAAHAHSHDADRPLRSTTIPVGFAWGEPAEIGTAAFWIEQCVGQEDVALQLGDTLLEEVAACLLGGYGIPGDVGVAAFERLRRNGALAEPMDETDVLAGLSVPFDVPGRPRPVRYRFARQRAQRLADAARVLDGAELPTEPRALRDWLAANIVGVGPKTASWIVRNRDRHARVAVIDIHVHRVGVGAGFFDDTWKLPRDYVLFEEAFLAVADLGGVAPGVLDHVIWSTMASVSLPTRAMLCRFALDLSTTGRP